MSYFVSPTSPHRSSAKFRSAGRGGQSDAALLDALLDDPAEDCPLGGGFAVGSRAYALCVAAAAVAAATSDDETAQGRRPRLTGPPADKASRLSDYSASSHGIRGVLRCESTHCAVRSMEMF